MKTSKKGFTLIELLIVIAIIGILAVAFLPSLLGAPAKGRDAQRLATVQKITNFLVSESLTGVSLPVTAPGCVTGNGDGTIGKLVTDKLSDFGGVFPKDPQITNNAQGVATCAGFYGYIKYADVNRKYTAGVYAKMENADNGNISCANAKADINSPPVLLETGECYLSLVQ